MPSSAEALANLKSELEPLRQKILQHPLYARLGNPADLRVFMERHIFAVWDFMTLLKCLQRQLTGCDLPWRPVGDPRVRRFINEIVLGEETDDCGDLGPLSHFELYLAAMRDAGCDLRTIERFQTVLHEGGSVESALQYAEVSKGAADFVRHTMQVAQRSAPHEVAAAFTFGREDLVPDLFRSVIAGLAAERPRELKTFQFYLDRHIELDEGEHGPMADRMMQLLCGEDARRWQEAARAATQALEARIRLWDAIEGSLAVR